MNNLNIEDDNITNAEIKTSNSNIESQLKKVKVYISAQILLMRVKILKLMR